MMNSQAAKASPRCALADRYQHDLVRGFERANAVDHQCIDDIPAPLRFLHDFGQCFFRHAGVVFQGHFGNRGAVIQIAHQADEAGDCADSGITPAQIKDFRAEVEIFGLYATGILASCHGWEESYFVAIPHGCVAGGHVLIDGHAYGFVLGKFFLPCAAALAQPFGQRLDIGDIGRQVRLL